MMEMRSKLDKSNQKSYDTISDLMRYVVPFTSREAIGVDTNNIKALMKMHVLKCLNDRCLLWMKLIIIENFP